MCVCVCVCVCSLDNKLVIYEASNHPDSPPLKLLTVREKAHAAGISCMSVNKDFDSSTWYDWKGVWHWGFTGLSC